MTNELLWHKVEVDTMDDGSGVYVQRREGPVFRSVEAHEAVTLDFDVEGNLVGIEIGASPKPKRLLRA